MNLTPWHPRSGHPLDLFRREMDSMLQDFFGGAGDGGRQHGLQPWVPQVDVVDRGNELVVKADLPGVDPKDVDITAEDGVLTIRGHREEEKETNENNVHRVERFSGRFHREIPLPRGTDLNQIHASSAKGVLTVTIPKKAEVQPRRIQISGEGGPKKAEAQPGKTNPAQKS